MTTFDPEQIKRWCPFPEGTAPEGWSEEYASSADYDKLLALYREAANAMERISSFGQGARAILEKRDITFKRFPRDLTKEPPVGDEIWEALAFTYYTDLWEVSMIAAHALTQQS